MRYHALLSLLLLLATGCEGWLHVQPASQSEATEFFQKESGYKAALTGLYIRLKSPALYGQTLTLDLPEWMVNHWIAAEDSENDHIAKHYYNDASTESTLDAIFLNMYGIIAEANAILEHIDQRQEVFAESRMYKLIKGEALGLRAFCHFELLRWWGPIPGTQTGARVLPYARVISTKPHAYLPYASYVALLMEDLDEAERLLRSVDPIQGAFPADNDPFWENRPSRLNYYAVCALKARLYLWNQEKGEALRYARMVIDAVNGGQAIFRLANRTEFASPATCILPSEHIFEMEVHTLSQLTNEWFTENPALYRQDRNTLMTLYETADARHVDWWGNIIEDGLVLHSFKKFIQSHSGKLPLIRLSELYLIAIECEDTRAGELYQLYCDTRGCVKKNLAANREEILLTEYNREFYGEGQLFFQYKRLSVPNMLWSKPIDDLQAAYVMPLPKKEIIIP
ncbi:MAG: RagB/SusD family nutrient uptake outer membrane protein [Odoribacteraceae bacterium]|jgi:hypothetical protein|nr:RagB/SusD family nutrient uptake outer membrane protein [Odoribacteraceae bacterium]